MAGFCEPAAYRIGALPEHSEGAYFDSFGLLGERFALSIGHAGSHRPFAAVIPGVRTQVRELLTRGETLADLSRILNERLCREMDGGCVTLLVAVHDPSCMTLEFLIAAHPWPFLFQPEDDTFRDIPANAPALGLLEDLSEADGAPIDVPSIGVKNGDVLVCFTDGVLERYNETHELYGTARMREATRTAVRGGASAAEIVDAITRDCDRHGNGQPPDDDVALLVARF